MAVFSWALMPVYAQDTTQLQTVEVQAAKLQLSAIGKRSDELDSSALQRHAFSSLAEALGANSTVFIKSYGPGAIATTALRGGSAAHTAVLWNGFNIQNNMLGQSDLSLLPVVLFDKISVEYGGSSALWGSGAVSGSLYLGSSPRFNQGLRSLVQLSAGSFGLFSAASKIALSQKRFFSSTKTYLRNANNNYRYLDTLNTSQPMQELRHAAFSFKGIMQEFRFLLSERHSLSLNAWYNQGIRQIPNFSSLPARAVQRDDNLRASLQWNYSGRSLQSSLRAAFLHDGILYNDSSLNLFSQNKVQTLIAEQENILGWSAGKLVFGVNATSAFAESGNYESRKELHKLSFLLGNRFNLGKDLQVYPSLRLEYFSAGALPLTGNIAFEQHIGKAVTAKLNAARVYRQPTFNELYWLPGGNPLLRPEQGYAADGDLGWQKKTGSIQLELGGSAFYRLIDDWILWVPGPVGSPAPLNLKQVLSRGTETRWKLTYSTPELLLQLQVMSSYVLSTIQKSRQENDESSGRQLIYTPRYSGSGIITFAYLHYSLVYTHQYCGYRFSSSDNSQWLNPYHFSSLRFNLSSRVTDETMMLLFAGCNNLFNSNYAIVAGRYMPLRHYEFGITLSARKKKRSEENESITNP